MIGRAVIVGLVLGRGVGAGAAELFQHGGQAVRAGGDDAPGGQVRVAQRIAARCVDMRPEKVDQLGQGLQGKTIVVAQ